MTTQIYVICEAFNVLPSTYIENKECKSIILDYDISKIRLEARIKST